MIVQRGGKTKPSLSQHNNQNPKGKNRHIRSRPKGPKANLCENEKFSSNLFLLVITILSTYLLMKRTWSIVIVPFMKQNSMIAHIPEVHPFLVTPELREKYVELLQILSDDVQYKGKLFQDSIDIIQHHIQQDSIFFSEIDKYPVFEAFIWLAEEPFSEKHFQNITVGMKPLSKINLMQRFALAVLYFSTKGDSHWKECSRIPSQSIVKAYHPSNISSFSPCIDASTGKASRFLSHADDECLWYGITCTSPGTSKFPKPQRIRMIDLTDNGLKGTLPLELVLLYW